MCGLLVLLLRPLLGALPRLVDALFAGSPRAELWTTMVLFPLALNTAQAWVQDSHLKAARESGGTPRHGRSGSRGQAGAPFGTLEAVREERGSEEGEPKASAGAAAVTSAAGGERDGAAAEDDKEAQLSPRYADS